MITESTKAHRYDARREPRTSLFVMATLYFGSGRSPVKVRDVSPGGAHIEGGGIPPPGTGVRLSRGSVTIAGEVSWRRGEKAGLRFESSLSVPEWLPGGARPHQDGVDRLVQQVKLSGSKHTLAPVQPPTFQSTKLSAEELTKLRIAIESLADDLAADGDVVERYISKLQTLDHAAQVLGRLAAER